MTTRILLPCLFSILLTACGGSGAPSSSEETTTNTPAASAEDAVEVKGKKARKAYTVEELNEPYSRVSPWRYIATSPECVSFKKLASKSSLARVIHNSGHAILVPEDMTFVMNKDWKGLLEEGQEEALDKFIGAHIIIGVKSPKSLEGIYENYNGHMVAIEKNETGELMCGGARLLGKEVETDAGLVIPILGLVDDFDWRR